MAVSKVIRNGFDLNIATIKSIHFSLSSELDIALKSTINVSNSSIFDGDLPKARGLCDLHMGTTNITMKCTTCHNDMNRCPGHFGRFLLNTPLLSPLFIKFFVVNILKIVCFKCGKIIINHKSTIPARAYENRTTILSKIIKLVQQNKSNKSSKKDKREERENKRTIYCVHCNHPHPNIVKDPNDFVSIYIVDNSGIRVRNIYPNEVLAIFNRISDDTVREMGLTPCCHPKNMVYKLLPVPPNSIRPEIRRFGEQRSNSDDITISFQSIINANSKLPKELPLEIGKNDAKIITDLQMIYYECVKGTDNETKKKTVVANKHKKITSLSKRWKGKEGRLRHNLNGRRVIMMARCPITCDPSLEMDQVGVPIYVAKNILIQMIIHQTNILEAMTYFSNGPDNYPGAVIIEKRDGRKFYIGNYKTNQVLEIGDVLYRHLVDNDYCNFNRAPSLESSSITSVRVRIDKKGYTIKINISLCNLWNADFDGDEMNLIFTSKKATMYEISNMSGVEQFFMSYKTSKPKIGLVQDSITACPALSASNNLMLKQYAMQLSNRCINTLRFDSYDEHVRGYDVITEMLTSMNTPISYRRKPTFNEELYRTFINFNENDMMVEIVNGKHISGMLDKSSIGQDIGGSIFHIINNQYSSKKALTAIYNLQQMNTEFQLTSGISVSMRDFIFSDYVISKIHELEKKVIYNSYEISNRLNRGELVPPVGKTLDEYHENLQLNELSLLDNDLYGYILNQINYDHNGLCKLIMHGAKGNLLNYTTITSAIGQLRVNGNRMPKSMGGRSCEYFMVGDDDPTSRGYITDCYINGLNPPQFLFHTIESRTTLVKTAMLTSETGYFNRKGVKNFESIIINNMRHCDNNGKITQLLFGGDGIDTRSIYTIPIPTLSADLTREEMAKRFRNESFEDEYKQLVADRELFIKIRIKWCSSRTDAQYSEVIELPTNISSIIDNIVDNNRDIEGSNDPAEAIKIVGRLVDYLPYIYVNERQYKSKMVLPDYLKDGIMMTRFAIRALLCTREIERKKINNSVLDLICSVVKTRIGNALMEYGRTAGILSVQAYSEPLTQLVLDSKHTSGIGAKKTGLYRVHEIMGVKPKDKMAYPGMSFRLDEENKTNKFIAYEIINNIKMLKLEKLILSTHVFFEKYNQIKHKDFKSDSEFIADFEKYSNNKTPNNLIYYCIRMELNKYIMIENHIDVGTVYMKLKELFPELYFVYTPDTSKNIIIRAYLTNNIKIKTVMSVVLHELVDKLKNTILRGLDGITNASFIEEKVNYIDSEGRVMKENVIFIYTDGINMFDIFSVPYIDYDSIQTDSILDCYEYLGIVAAKNRIAIDLLKQLPSVINLRHTTIYADEMTYNGCPTSVDRFGSSKRNTSLLQQISDSSPAAIITQAAVYEMSDNIKNLSSSIIMGQTPAIGVTYNKFILNQEFVNKQSEDIDKLFDEYEEKK
jgi:DNA-directed RNA polymerase II subunit RPB1